MQNYTAFSAFMSNFWLIIEKISPHLHLSTKNSVTFAQDYHILTLIYHSGSNPSGYICNIEINTNHQS